MTKNVRRLAEQYRPDHYIVDLKPDKDKMTFCGTVIISGRKTGRPSKRITFHQSGLTISEATITKNDKDKDLDIEVTRLNQHALFQEIRLHTSQIIYPGKYTVRLEFKGKITTAMNGVYPCVFNSGKKNKKLIATQFESHYAREVFPSIDEPEAKATFDLVLTAPKNETVIANTPIKNQEAVSHNPLLTKTTFETTPKMSTYLLAFVYGELSFIEATTRDKVKVRAYATQSNVKFTEFALSVAVKCLEFYNDYFGIPYPLEKCDLIALPDFASGAMENWGCITFREQTLLVDTDNTSLGTKQYVAMVVAHELAHQWFGNLVTMRWWTDLWLNEGFASWIEYLAIDALFPDWQMWTQFTVGEQQQAMKLDALLNTHPVEVAVNHPDEIRTIFDAISYSKGSSVIHMLHNYLGPKIFKEGLSYYLQKHAYGSTDTTDLWAALEKISGRPVRDFMHKWTSQSGFPIVTANITDTKIELSQSRFLFNLSAGKSLDYGLWPIPLLSKNQTVPEIMKVDKTSYQTTDSTHTKFNQNQGGFYRVTYNSTHQERLKSLVVRGQFNPVDRLGLLSDTFEAAKAGYFDTSDALNFLQAYKNEDNAAVWDVISGSLGSVRAVMDDENLRQLMKPYLSNLVSTQLKRLGWEYKEKESHFDSLLRPTVIGLSSIAEDKKTVDKCLRLFSAITKSDNSINIIHPDLRGIVYGTVARLGSEIEFNKLKKMHDSTDNSEERVTISAALTSFKQPNLINESLSLIKTNGVRAQDIGYWVAYSFMNRFARYDTWEWLKTNWIWLEEKLAGDLSFYRFPIYAARAFSDEKFIQEFEAFFSKLRSPALNRSIEQGLEIIQWQAAWKKRDHKKVLAFFTAQSPQNLSH